MQAEAVTNVLHMDRTEWLKARKQGLGGSDCGTIMGVNKWKSSFQLFLEKTGDYIEEIDNEFIYWGNRLEDMVAEEFAKRTGKKVRRNNHLLVHPEHDFMLANLDRVVVGERALLECKTTSAYNKDQWESDNVPATYLCQIQHYLAVTGYEKAYIAVLIGGNHFVWKEIPRDDELIEMIIEREKHFWENHVLANNPPPIDGSPAASEFLNKLYPDDNGETIMLSEEEDKLIDALEHVKAEMKDLEALKKRYENELKMKLEDSTFGVTSLYEVSYKSQVRNTIDSKRLREEMPDIAKKYMKSSQSRPLKIKKTGGIE